MESTSVNWIQLFSILEANGIKVSGMPIFRLTSLTSGKRSPGNSASPFHRDRPNQDRRENGQSFRQKNYQDTGIHSIDDEAKIREARAGWKWGYPGYRTEMSGREKISMC